MALFSAPDNESANFGVISWAIPEIARKIKAVVIWREGRICLILVLKIVKKACAVGSAG
jgi:hypothetical protein